MNTTGLSNSTSFFRKAAGAMCLVLAAGTALSQEHEDGYTWYRSRVATQTHEWNKVSGAILQKLCGSDKFRAEACTLTSPGDPHCIIYSRHTEAQAKEERIASGTLWEHEMKHCEGWSHVETSEVTGVAAS